MSTNKKKRFYLFLNRFGSGKLLKIYLSYKVFNLLNKLYYLKIYLTILYQLIFKFYLFVENVEFNQIEINAGLV